MIHENDEQRYLPSSAPCPTCGRPFPALPMCAPFEPGLSALLDWLQVAEDAIHQAKAVAEEEVVP